MNILDKTRKAQILSSFETKEVNKAYTEGIYADTPANRKLGRVGMSYTAYANKTNGDPNSLKDFKKNGNEYSAEIEGKQVKIFQEGSKHDKHWVIEKEGEKCTNDNGKTMTFNSLKDAINKTYSIIEEDKGDYKFPSPDYLEFKSVLWKNPDTSDTKLGQIHIHKYGKNKPELRISSKNGLDQTVVLLKNSEMKTLLQGLAKKENVSLQLKYSDEDIQNWTDSHLGKEANLNYDADKGTINYTRSNKNYTFPASALDRVLEQFKK